MHPIICKIGPFTIYSYGLMLALAFLFSVSLAKAEAKRQKLNSQIIFNFCLISFIFGIIGGRIFYIVENIAYYLRDPLEIIMLQHGGLSWFGGLFAGALSGVLYLKNKEESIYKILDLIAPFLALAQAIGRIGCLLNGCCFGRTVVPIQIYSSLFLLLIFMALRFLQAHSHKKGEVFFVYLMLYCLKRFFIEFWRMDNPVIFFRLTLFQLISIVIFLLTAIKYAGIRLKGRA